MLENMLSIIFLSSFSMSASKNIALILLPSNAFKLGITLTSFWCPLRWFFIVFSPIPAAILITTDSSTLRFLHATAISLGLTDKITISV